MSKTAFEYFNSAYYKNDSGDYQGALTDYNQAIEINPQYAIAYINRAVLKKDHFQDYQGALSDYNQAIEINPQYVKAYTNRANLKQYHLQDYQGALTDYNQAIEINPQHDNAYNNRALLKENHLQDYQGALSDYNQAIEINPQYAEAYYNLAILKQDHFQDYQGALSDYNQAIEIDPQFAKAYYNRGVLKKNHLQDYQGALTDYNQTIEIDPQITIAFNNRKNLLESHPYLKQEQKNNKFNEIKSRIKPPSSTSEAPPVPPRTYLKQEVQKQQEQKNNKFNEIKSRIKKAKAMKARESKENNSTENKISISPTLSKSKAKPKTSHAISQSLSSLQSQFEEKLHHQEQIVEEKLQLMMKNIQESSQPQQPTQSEMSKESIENLFKQLWDQKETILMKQLTSQSVENELISLRNSEENLNKEIQKIKTQIKDNPEMKSRLDNIEKEMAPLIEEYNEKQLKLQAQQYILQDLSLKSFYNRVQVKLNQLFMAYMAICSGKIEKSPDWIDRGFNLFQIIGIPIAKEVASVVKIAINRKKSKKINKIANDFIVSITMVELVVENVARNLTIRYSDQIKQLTVPGEEGLFKKIVQYTGPNGGSETLAECVVGRIIDALTSQMINSEDDLSEQLIDCVFYSTYKQGSILGLTTQKIATKANKDWTDEGIFQRSGIKIEVNGQIQYYKGIIKDTQCSRPEKYGYRWGTLKEVQKLKLKKHQPVSSQSSITPSPAFGKFIKQEHTERKAVNEKQEYHEKMLQREMEHNRKLEQQLEEMKKQQLAMQRQIAQLMGQNIHHK